MATSYVTAHRPGCCPLRPDLPRGQTVGDPACGIGTLLSGLIPAPGLARFGQDSDEDCVRIARARAVLTGREGIRIAQGDALHADRFPGLAADLVVCDLPAADRLGARSTSARPSVGVRTHSRTQGELAGLVRRGVIRKIVALTGGVASSHDLPVHLWLLRRPADNERARPDTVTMLDLTSNDPVGNRVPVEGLSTDVPKQQLTSAARVTDFPQPFGAETPTGALVPGALPPRRCAAPGRKWECGRQRSCSYAGRVRKSA